MNSKTGASVYEFGVKTQNRNNGADKQKLTKASKPEQKVEAKAVEPVVKVNAVANVTVASSVPNPNEDEGISLCRAFLNKHKIDKTQFAEMRLDAMRKGKPVTNKKFNELTYDEWVDLIGVMESLWCEGFFGDVA